MERKIEGVTVCVDYSDFLEVTLPQAKKVFDNVIVVTSSRDKETQRIAGEMGADVVVTDSFYDNGDSFNRGKGINKGFERLKYCDWVCNFDSDIYFPKGFREGLEKHDLNEKFIYGVNRCNLEGRKNYENYILGKWFSEEICQYDNFWKSNSIPLGYFQLFNWVLPTWYPEGRRDASYSDVDFSVKWNVEHRKYIDDLMVYHLVSDRAILGQNWEGRKSAKF